VGGSLARNSSPTATRRAPGSPPVSAGSRNWSWSVRNLLDSLGRLSLRLIEVQRVP
jgi:hypothetical protein